MEVIVTNHKKTFGSWHRYSTRCKFYDIEFETNMSNGIWTYPERDSGGDVKRLITTFILEEKFYDYKSDQVVPNYVPFQPNFFIAKGKATNRGVGYDRFTQILKIFSK